MKNFSIKRFIAYLRRQPRHMQHVYSFIVAAVSTGLVAFVILYTDYGFWHERYVADSGLTGADTSVVVESPGEMLSRFWNDAHAQFGGIKTLSTSLLQGTDTYTSTTTDATTTGQY